MAGRPVFYPQLGEFFVGLRRARGWTQHQAEDIAARRKLLALTRQVLWRLEKGKIKNPEPQVLRAIAKLYEVPYDELVARVVQHRYGVPVGQTPTFQEDLIRHRIREQSAASPQEVADVPASARLLELERRIADYEARLRDVQDVAGRLVRILEGIDLTARTESESARARSTGRRRRHRKAG